MVKEERGQPRANGSMGRKTFDTRRSDSSGKAPAARRRSSRTVQVDMSAILPALEKRNSDINNEGGSHSSFSLDGTEINANVRRVTVPMRKQGSRQSLVNSIHDHPLMEAMGQQEGDIRRDSRRRNKGARPSSLSSSVGSVGDANRTRSSSISSQQLHASASKSATSSSVRMTARAGGSGTSNKIKIKRGRRSDDNMSTSRSIRSVATRRTSNTSRASSSREARGSAFSSSSTRRRSYSSDESSTSSRSCFDVAPTCTHTTRSSRSGRGANELDSGVRSKIKPASKSSIEEQLNMLKIEVADAKCVGETLEREVDVLKEQNRMLRTELCATKASEVELQHTVASLQDEIDSLRAERNASIVNEEALESHTLSRRSPGLNAVTKAVGTLLGSEIQNENNTPSETYMYVAPLAPPQRKPVRDGREGEEKQTSLVGRLRRTLSSASFDTSSLYSLNLDDEIASNNDEDGPRPRRSRRRPSFTGTCSIGDSVEDEESPRTHRARRRSSVTSADDAAEVQCELNVLADENDDLRQKNESLEAERDRLRQRLNQIMSVEASTLSFSKEGAHELYGSDYEEDLQAEGSQPPSSIRDFMTKVTSMRNMGNNANSSATGPTTRAARMPNRRTESVESLLWDSFNEDTMGRSSSRDDDIFTSVSSVLENSEVPSGSFRDEEQETIGREAEENRLEIDDYSGAGRGKGRPRHKSRRHGLSG